MREIFINDNNLKIEDLDYEVIRVKVVLINEDGNIILVHNNNTYQFPGGHVEDGEDMIEAVKREIREETGMIDVKVFKPFMLIKTYAMNYFNSGKNVCNKIYDFLDHCHEKVSINEEELDELEKQSNFSIVYIKEEKLKDFLDYHTLNSSIDPSISREMTLVAFELSDMRMKEII